VARPSATPAELEAFYRELFMPLVRRATWTHGLEKEDARDVVQEAFVIALGKIDAQRNPKAWLIQVVDNLALNQKRKMQRRARLTARWVTPTSLESESMEGPSTSESRVNG
jgi:DNA-directed RNA polymerase specialized sigma24 family protein